MKIQRKIIVGLGNPGENFKATYHNVGQLALHALVKQMEENGAEIRFQAHKKLFTFAVAGDVALVIPATFMNDAGATVREVMKKFGAAAKDLIVIHDESDLLIGTYKISTGKNSAGHRGAQSIMDALRTKNFMRVRVGIRKAREAKREKASAFVLKKIAPKDRRVLGAVFRKIADELLALG